MSLSRKERRRRQVAQERRRRRLLIGVPIVLVLVIFGTLIYIRLLRPIPGLEEFGGQDRGHDAEAQMTSAEGRPPVGGTHNPNWQNCGVYDRPLEEALAVHSMEHGAVWLTYQPDLPAEKVDQLASYAQNSNFILVSPYPDLDSPVVASAWGVQLAVDDVPDERLEQFISRYQGQGPEQGATCSGGVGSPIG